LLYFLTKARSSHTIWRFIWGAGWRRLPFLRPLSYEELFHRQTAPVGHYVFTDFDRMSPYEIQCAEQVARQVQARHPTVRIHNHPARALERVPLLMRLQQAGLNDFGVTRIDGGERPAAYPVFIRSEDDCKRPDTGLLDGEAAFDAALADLRARGVPLKRRIAVQYRGQAAPDGYFRKYGALRIGGRFVLQHIQRNTDWYVKRGQVERDAAFQTEFTALYDDFTHAAALEPVFAMAGLDYGRADYAFVDGRMQVYEINSNPTIPKLRRRREHNGERYERLGPALLAAFAAMNTPHESGRPVPFKLPRPRLQAFPPLDRATWAYLFAHRLRAVGTILNQPAIPGFESTRGSSRKSAARP
jgi:hypothetical protein